MISRPCLLVLSTIIIVGAQTAAPNAQNATFDVVSVKANKSGSGSTMVGTQPGGRFVMTNGTLQTLILNAYGYLPFEVAGLPQWASAERYDVIAQAGRAVALDEMHAMMKALLADRFKLVTHVDVQELPAYTLVRVRPDGQLGPRLKAWDVDCAAVAAGRGAPAPKPSAQPARPAPPMCGMTAGPGYYMAGGVTLAALASSLQSTLERRVADKTGLPGEYEIAIRWAADDREPGDLPSLFTALQEQLGLKLEPGKAPAKVLVVDRIERPTEN